jgi:aminoglycoside phosphotransferase (APT) family kinase protein
MNSGTIAEPVLAQLGIANVTSVTSVTGGADALLWRVEIGDDAFALRVLRPDQAAQSEREILLNQWMSDHEIPAPGIIASGTWQDRPAYLMRWIDGQPLASVLTSDTASLTATRKLLFEFGVLQARIHATPPPPQLEQGTSFLYRHSNDAELNARLEAESAQEHALLHLDYHPLNVMVERGTITAVLDWANARTSDRRFDLARTRAIIELAPIEDEMFQPMISQAIALWKEGYESVAGALDIPPLFRWWAATFIEGDLSHRVGNPAVPWLTEAYLDRVRAHANDARSQTLNSG